MAAFADDAIGANSALVINCERVNISTGGFQFSRGSVDRANVMDTVGGSAVCVSRQNRNPFTARLNEAHTRTCSQPHRALRCTYGSIIFGCISDQEDVPAEC